MGTNIEYTITDRHILISQKNKPQTQNTLQSGATIRVNGQVTDENGESLPGVTVRVKGSKTATATDIDGNYSLNVRSNDILEFSYVGFATREFKASDVTSTTVKRKF